MEIDALELRFAIVRWLGARKVPMDARIDLRLAGGNCSYDLDGAGSITANAHGAGDVACEHEIREERIGILRAEPFHRNRCVDGFLARIGYLATEAHERIPRCKREDWDTDRAVNVADVVVTKLAGKSHLGDSRRPNLRAEFVEVDPDSRRSDFEHPVQQRVAKPVRFSVGLAYADVCVLEHQMTNRNRERSILRRLRLRLSFQKGGEQVPFAASRADKMKRRALYEKTRNT